MFLKLFARQVIIIFSMGVQKFLLKWFALSVLGAGFYFYLQSFAPYREDGSLNATTILIAFSLLAILAFFILQAAFSLFYRHKSANQLAFISSFALIQVILINSWSFISLSSIVIIIFFNFFICWYALKVL